MEKNVEVTESDTVENELEDLLHYQPYQNTYYNCTEMK